MLLSDSNQKLYFIFVSFHWSLVIIQLGQGFLLEQIIVHLDSMDQEHGHDSNRIFEVLKRYVIKSYLLVVISELQIAFNCHR